MPEGSIRTSPTLLDARTRAAGSCRRDRRAVFGIERHGIFLQTQIGAAFQQPPATVPREDGVVVALWAQVFGFPEAAQRLLEKRGKGGCEAPGVCRHLHAPFFMCHAVIQ